MEFVFVPDQCLSFYFLLMGLANRVLLKPVPWGGRGGGGGQWSVVRISLVMKRLSLAKSAIFISGYSSKHMFPDIF